MALPFVRNHQLTFLLNRHRLWFWLLAFYVTPMNELILPCLACISTSAKTAWKTCIKPTMLSALFATPMMLHSQKSLPDNYIPSFGILLSRNQNGKKHSITIRCEKICCFYKDFSIFFVFPDFASNRCTFLVSTQKQPQKKRFRQSLLDHILLRTVHITPSFSL